MFFGFFFCCFLLFSWFQWVFLVPLQYEAEPMQEKGLSLDGGRFHSRIFMYFVLSWQYVTLCFALNSKSCRTEVMHRLLPVGSNNMQSLYNLPFSKPLCRCKVINEYNKYDFSQSVRCVMEFQQLHACIHFIYRVPAYIFV